MIELVNLNISDSKEMSFVERLYIESFPQSERRPFELMIDFYSDPQKPFIITVIKNDDKPIGVFTYWDFDNYIFGEHFAIAPEARNGGVGAESMTIFMSGLDKPFIIEVELPTTYIADRRIGFYQRLGFRLWDKLAYQQPPYIEGYNPIAMYLMTWGKIDMNEVFPEIKREIYSSVYGF